MPNRFILEFMRTCIHDYALLICTSHTHATLRSEQSALVSWQSGFCNSKPSILLVVSGTSAPVSHKTLLTIINIQSFTKLSSNFRLFASKHHITCICFWTALEPYSTGTLTFYSGEGHSSVPILLHIQPSIYDFKENLVFNIFYTPIIPIWTWWSLSFRNIIL